MKKRMLFLATFVLMALMAVFNLGFAPAAKAGDPSCNGKCNRSQNACLATARTTSEAAQCNKAYQGCISSCH
ncbi:MAG TPA: hypothetical protein VF507_02535 [Pyrinomonadaceae bacterium]|jgi:hypothetical protein